VVAGDERLYRQIVRPWPRLTFDLLGVSLAFDYSSRLTRRSILFTYL
jgi:hypothetical protein